MPAPPWCQRAKAGANASSSKLLHKVGFSGAHCLQAFLLRTSSLLSPIQCGRSRCPTMIFIMAHAAGAPKRHTCPPHSVSPSTIAAKMPTPESPPRTNPSAQSRKGSNAPGCFARRAQETTAFMGSEGTMGRLLAMSCDVDFAMAAARRGRHAPGN